MFHATHELETLRRREFQRLLALSAALHVMLVVAVAFAPSFGQPLVLPGVVAVDLVAAPPGGAPPAPAPPQPEAAPPEPAPVKPAPPPPVQERVVIPEKATRDPVKPKPTPKPAPKPAPAAPQEDYADVLERLRREAGETSPPAEVAEAGPASGGGGPGVRVTPEVMAWMRRARHHVRGAWVLAPGLRAQPLETQVVVTLDAEGHVQGEPRIVSRSGNPWYDESVVRAILKASPLPAPPDAGEWPFVFRPEEY